MSGPTQAWEYRSVEGMISDSELNELGRDGWELVAVGGDTAAPRLFFKRLGPNFRERVTLDQKRRVYAEAARTARDDGVQR